MIQHLLNLTMTFVGNGYDTAKDLSLPAKSRKIPGCLDLLIRDGPKELHIHRQLISLAQIPKTEDEFKKWIFEKWYEKNQLLINFEKDRKFGTSKITSTMPSVKTWSWQAVVFITIFFLPVFFSQQLISFFYG